MTRAKAPRNLANEFVFAREANVKIRLKSGPAENRQNYLASVTDMWIPAEFVLGRENAGKGVVLV